MKKITKSLILLYFITFNVFAESTLFGLIIGKSTLEDVKQTLALPDSESPRSGPPNWIYYTVEGSQFQMDISPKPINIKLHFDNNQILGRLTLWWKIKESDQLFNVLDEMMNNSNYSKKSTCNLKREWIVRETCYQDKATQVNLVDTSLFGTNLDFVNLKHLEALNKFRANKPNKDIAQ